VVTAQPADDKTQPVAAKPKPVYSHKTLVRIKHARVARDLTLCVGGIVFTVLSFVIPVPSYTVNDPIWIFALVISVVFGLAALIRGLGEPKWERTSSRTVRRWCSAVAMVFGAYFMVFALDQSGYIGLTGSGVATDCKYVSHTGLRSSTHAYLCDVEVHWSDGSTTQEDLDATMPVNSGQTVKYAKAPQSGLLSIFPIKDQPVAAWTGVWFYLLTGAVIFLQAAFAFSVVTFTRKPKMA
jgi:hypothetical protein